MKVVDLFSGLGGFSQAFIDRGHEVTRFDFDERFSKVPNTIIRNVMELSERDLGKPDIIVASPPCNCFSLMSVYHYWDNKVPKERTMQAIELVKHTYRIIKKTKYWIIENPVGMLKHVLPIPYKITYWGSWYSSKDPIMQIVEKPPLKPTFIFGELPLIDWRPKPSRTRTQEARRGAKAGTQDPRLTPEIRAMVPYEFSLAVCLGVEGNQLQQALT